MHKNFHNKIQSLPQGIPANPWVNLFWLLMFTPFILLLAGFVGFVFWALGEWLFKSIFA